MFGFSKHILGDKGEPLLEDWLARRPRCARRRQRARERDHPRARPRRAAAFFRALRGLIEGTVLHLVGMRLDGPGMRWGKARAEAVLHLRCVLFNGLWADFESYLARRDRLRLVSKPVPTVTHDAKPQVKMAA